MGRREAGMKVHAVMGRKKSVGRAGGSGKSRGD